MSASEVSRPTCEHGPPFRRKEFPHKPGEIRVTQQSLIFHWPLVGSVGFLVVDFCGELGINVMEGRGRDGIRSGVTAIVNVTICPLQCALRVKPVNVLNTLAIENSF